MYYLQVVQSDKYKMLSDENRISTQLLPPPRGRILDRFGQPLAYNKQQFQVLVIPEQAPKIGNPLKDVDVALRLARPTQGDMLMRKVGDMAYALYASPAYIEARGHPSQMQDIAGHDLIGFPRSETPLGPIWWFSRAEKSARIALRSSSVAARAAAAREGLGLAALPCIMGDTESGLVRVFGPDVLGSLELWLMARNDLAQLAHVRAVMEFVVDAVKRHRARLEGRDHEVRELPVRQRPNH
jgi:DNA-binding transcriptional LysR family regulator